MAALGTYCFDGLNFSQATSLFTDSGLTTLAPNGWYSQGGIIRQQLNGVLLNAQPCSTCYVPCGSGVNASFSSNGLFDASIDVANDVGAIVLYFYMTSSVPDGVLATYNSNTYNRLTCEGNHNTYTIVDGSNTQVDYSGINNQGTGRITYVGNSNTSLLSDSPYNTTPSGTCTSGDKPQNYTYTGSSYVAQGTYETVTVASNEIGVNPGGASRVFTMVVPKTSASPSTINLLIGAPMCGTFFRWEVDCPVALPSFTASAAQSTTACAASTTTYYFARNATGTSNAFVVDTNTTPNVGNWVFSDANGSTYLNDTSTIQYYIIANTTAIGVRNGVVVSSAACSSSNSLRLTDCVTSDPWTATNTYNNTVGQVIQYRIGSPGSGTIYCGTVSLVNQSGVNDATIENGNVYGCGDTVHCTPTSNNTSFFATSGTTTLNDGTCGNTTGTLLYHNGTGTLPQVGDTIYSGSSSGSSTVTWSNYRGMGPADVGDGVVTTAIVNASGVVQTTYNCP